MDSSSLPFGIGACPGTALTPAAQQHEERALSSAASRGGEDAVPARRQFPKDMLIAGSFPSLPVAVEERISAAAFSKTNDRWLAVFNKTEVLIYDTTHMAEGSKPIRRASVCSDQSSVRGTAPAGAGAGGGPGAAGASGSFGSVDAAAAGASGSFGSLDAAGTSGSFGDLEDVLLSGSLSAEHRTDSRDSGDDGGRQTPANGAGKTRRLSSVDFEPDGDQPIRKRGKKRGGHAALIADENGATPLDGDRPPPKAWKVVKRIRVVTSSAYNEQDQSSQVLAKAAAAGRYMGNFASCVSHILHLFHTPV